MISTACSVYIVYGAEVKAWEVYSAPRFLGISRIAILENLKIFFDNMVSFCRKRQNKCDRIHYVISSASCSSVNNQST